MADEHNKERMDRRGDELRPPSASSDLLDLVRSAEDEARLALRKRTPAVPMKLAASPSDVGYEEEFVDVGDEAIDAPPSLPPLRAATPAAAFTTSRRSSPGAALDPAAAPKGMRPAEPDRRSLPPAVSIGLVLVFAVGVLFVLTR